MKRQDFLITYDVDTSTKEGARRLKKVAKLCENYGQRVQYSVFVCSLDRSQLETFEAQLIDLIEHATDSLHIYTLVGGRDQCLRAHGVDRYRNFDAPLIF